MKKAFLTILIACFSFISLATEGMWIPLLLKSLNEADMQAMGLKLTADDIYSINHSSLKDAVVHFGGGCTAEVISNEGLILTNHHCGFGQIQNHSSEEHNYLKNGFWAMSRDKELKNENLTATFIIRIEDVTQKVLQGDAKSMKENIARIEKEAVEGTHYDAQIKPFFYGNEYYMIVTETYRDVRLVGAPPSSIGKFGGDTDNWVWPRHTGDFSMFRIYADKDNNPADISDDNVPYKPKHSFPIAMHDMQEGEFCMVYGFPGRTYQYLTSYALDYVMNKSNPSKIKMRETSLAIIDATMKSSEKKYIQYAAKQSRISNAYKKWIGQNIGLRENEALQKKLDFERSFQQKAKGNKEYENLLAEFESLYKEMNDYQFARDMLIEFYYMGPEILRFAGGYSDFEDFEKVTANGPGKFAELKEARFKSIKKYFKNYDKETDKKVFVALIKMYKDYMPDHLEPETLQLVETKFKGNYQAYADYVYNKSVFCDESKMNNFMRSYNKGYAKKMLKDPAYILAQDIMNTFRDKVAAKYGLLNTEIESKMKTYLKARMELFPERKYAADANSTLRLTYGKVEGSAPRDGMTYTYYTTLDGMIQKNNLGSDDFKLEPRMIELWKKKDYGQYAQDGELRVCFTGSNHTTGGNSGSPVLNGKGELIGLNFDRSWESTMSDYLFDPGRCRNIAVDIRYVLWVVDKYAGAGHLVDEMNIVKGAEMERAEIKLPIKEIDLFELLESRARSSKSTVSNVNAYALALVQRGDMDEAWAQVDRSLKIDTRKNAEAYYIQALILKNKKNGKDAMISVNQALNIQGYYGEAFYLRGQLNKEAGREKEACADFGLAAKALGGKYIEEYRENCLQD